MEVGARPGANRQRQDRRHRRSRQPADRRVRRFGGGQTGQADTQLATARAAASRRRTRISHPDRRYWQNRLHAIPENFVVPGPYHHRYIRVDVDSLFLEPGVVVVCVGIPGAAVAHERDDDEARPLDLHTSRRRAAGRRTVVPVWRRFPGGGSGNAWPLPRRVGDSQHPVRGDARYERRLRPRSTDALDHATRRTPPPGPWVKREERLSPLGPRRTTSWGYRAGAGICRRWLPFLRFRRRRRSMTVCRAVRGPSGPASIRRCCCCRASRWPARRT